MPAGDSTLTTSAAILKTKYNQPKVYWLAYKNNPGFATIRKDESFGGANKIIAVQTEAPQGAGANITIAQQNLNPGQYSAFTITRVSDYAVARITGEAMKAAEGNENALLALWKREMDGALHVNKRSASIHLFRTGKGGRGVISAGSNINTSSITLATTTDITNFSVKMRVQAAASDGAAYRSSGANAQIQVIDRVNGTMNTTNAWDTYIAAIAAGDTLSRNGDGANASTNVMLTGMGGWCPQTAPTAASFFGVDRSSDTVRLGGLRYNATGVPMSEALVEATSMVQVEGAEGDLMAWIHPRDRANLTKELGARVQFTRVETAVKGSSAKIGFDAVKVNFDGTEVTMMSDLNVPKGTVFVSQWDTWSLESLGPAPQILNFDKNDFLRLSADDSYEVRVGYYAQVACAAPAFTVNMFNFGQ